ncbi:D-alanyl-D-alanine dipeptidase [Rhodospirillum centenum]|uniref:D-alanyl-D-alanine dipeptidase n=1 Tax=Rhodospirillum centenum (strain ATCC 51521 / SW) TaxID=414684 RepID=B6IUR1_RHOCS|nr:D-alanyl-D-alanine dipeptidase [Rhodospirillum centenum]ACI99992.1 D-alanyl-D-alanine dipeptidase VanX [Rhodospirillum centenum SW]
MPFVTIAPPAVGLDLDLRYATPDNLTGSPIYARPLCLLHPDAAAALGRAVALAAAQGLRLRVFDAYRPPAAQWRLWRAFPDPDFIADPRTGSNHSRGVAVDLTLDTEDGTPLAMGGGFDAMGPLAAHGCTAVPVQAQRNRCLLAGLMVSAGWQPYDREWWHYQLPGAAAYPLVEDGAMGPRLM